MYSISEERHSYQYSDKARIIGSIVPVWNLGSFPSLPICLANLDKATGDAVSTSVFLFYVREDLKLRLFPLSFWMVWLSEVGMASNYDTSLGLSF